MQTVDGLVLSDLSLGQRVRLARVAVGLRQLDVASMADVPLSSVSDVELERSVKTWKLARIVAALGLDCQP